jgi:hypothetical protein
MRILLSSPFSFHWSALRCASFSSFHSNDADDASRDD